MATLSSFCERAVASIQAQLSGSVVALRSAVGLAIISR